MAPHSRLSQAERDRSWQESRRRWEEVARRLAAIAEGSLALPQHMIDRGIDQAWDNEIVDDTDLLVELSGWMDRLIIVDPGFLRRVFEGWKEYLRDDPTAGLPEK